MGFSVSGSAAIIFLAAFISVGLFYSAAYNSYELVDAAEDDKTQDLLSQQNTAIEIVDINTSNSVNVTVRNTGSTEISVADTDLLINGTYRPNVTTYVENDSSRTLWLPGENLTIEDTDYNPTGTMRIKVITIHGVSAFEEVTG